MKSLLLTIGLLTFTLLSYSQNIYQIRADSVRIYNDCDTAEFILENHTQMVPGYLYNKGRGRTEFRRMRFIDLGLGLIAIGDQDTLNFGNALGNSFIKNQFSTAQIADYWIKGRGRIDSTFTLSKYKNNATEDSVLTTDVNGNIKLKLAGGGGGVQTLQQVTDTGNTTTNVMLVTGSDRKPLSSPAALELGFSTSTEYLTQGPIGNISVRSRSTDEWGDDNSTAGFLNLDSKGLVVTNSLNAPSIRGMITANEGNSYQYPFGFTVQGEYVEPEVGFWSVGQLNLNPKGGKVIIGGIGSNTSGEAYVKINSAVGFNIIGTRSIATDYINRDTYTTLINESVTRTLHIPRADVAASRIIVIKKVINNSNAITLDVEDGAGLIDNQTSVTLTSYLSSITLQSDGTNWWILSRLGN